MDQSITPSPQTPKKSPKAEALKQFSSLPSSISKLSGSSRGIPCNKDYHFYINFEEFKNPIQEIGRNSQLILETIGSSAEWGKKQVKFPTCDDLDDDDDVYDWLVGFNDELFERFDASVDEFRSLRNKEEETGVRVMNNVAADDGFQLVQGRKKKGVVVNNGNGNNVSGGNELGGSSSSSVKVAVGTPKAKVPFHIASIRRPQDEYKILVNNANQPFEHVWLQRSEDGCRVIHPLEKLSVMDFIDKTVSDVEPVKPSPVESTSFKLVQDVKDLKELAAKLRDANEFAVDLEHNQYRSFQGLTCLMQISTRTEDFIVDTLKLRVQIGPYLREVFKDPTKRKVMHGADRDIIWLQRDFGIYVCNMFDTGQASKVLKLERNSLEFLLRYFCGVAANKEYQNADWRLRPLTAEMLRYATEDTHYLLYIYDLMKKRLLSSSTDPDCPEAALVEVYQRSYDVCMQLYQKEILTENSYLNLYGLHAADLSGQQLAIVAGLFEWRDVIARSEDESTGYILPNKVLIEIAKQMPVTPGKLRHLLKSKLPYIERNLGAVVSIIRHSMQNAVAFEPVAKKLKEEYIEMMAARNAKLANGEEATEAAGNESTSNAVEDDSFEKEVGNFIVGANQNHKLDGSSASRVSIEVQKKPSRAFGSMFGNAAGKRKFNLESKATEEIKVEQIKSSVSLPFRSFTDKTEPSSHPVAKEPPRPQENPVLPLASEPETDVIMLESDSDVEEEKEEKPAKDEEGSERKTEGENNVILLDSDCSDEENGEDKNGNEETMSLSDLSSSFQKCVDTANETIQSDPVVEGGSTGLVEVKPFDYAAARKEGRFGEEGSGDEDGDGGKSKGKGGRKKAGGGGGRKESAGGERSGDFQMGRRRQAFPATGNRSSTFR
ncbi:putative ribonuclease D [Helianthus annuus]|uniref:Ribonuclease D n=1 Tax=Helianthus annuus TaxID=4232 RepID=A0A251UBT4_HELAN|nr:protein RRP6-like 2 [Helianthus annuus]KAF5799371.1 putative ribonuclease D [Helianthus annuus]KAJ0731863.1 putative ribonuclease D [Helianthus annuus]KAJ0905443.1 putative ribonuclease D [Helianthus annuus]KAJ0908727.1 putative ribonuclease D [Helianthus annuus]